jgi:hypothetical protein
MACSLAIGRPLFRALIHVCVGKGDRKALRELCREERNQIFRVYVMRRERK